MAEGDTVIVNNGNELPEKEVDPGTLSRAEQLMQEFKNRTHGRRSPEQKKQTILIKGTTTPNNAQDS